MQKRLKDRFNKVDVSEYFLKLEKLYNKIPGTKGCLESISKPKKDGGCGGWCCEFQNPQVLYVEFLYAWKHILNEWNVDNIIELIERSIRSYLSEMPTKGCVFFNKENKTCTVHSKRPYNCRIYGITPEEEFKPRYERLKVLYQDHPFAVIRDQCDLVKTENGEKVTIEDTTNWWEEIVEIEKNMGIKEEEINDDDGGSYRTFHDHILLQICGDDIMEKLQNLRINGKFHEKEIAVKNLMVVFRNSIKNKVKN